MEVDIMDREQQALLLSIMEASFVSLETALYLNTHPDDERALRLHNNAAQQQMQLEEMYTSRYGPLRNNQLSRFPWAYINDPWPWDMEFNMC
jgi:spore coat protein JB